MTFAQYVAFMLLFTVALALVLPWALALLFRYIDFVGEVTRKRR